MHVPHPIKPNNVTIDAHAATFTWTLAPDATDHEVAVGSSSDFAQALVTIGAGPTDSLILYETLPEDGTQLFWKVRAKRGEKWSAWSDTVPFISGSEDIDDSVREESEGVVSSMATQETVSIGKTKKQMTTSNKPAPVEIAEPIDGTTSAGSAAAYMLMMIVSFGVLMMMLAAAVPK